MDQARIGPVLSHQRGDALAVLCGRLPDAERQPQIDALLTGAATSEVAVAGLLGAYRGDRLVGSVLAQVQAGRAAVLWPPRTVRDEPATTAARLLQAASDWLATQDVRMAQALLPPQSAGDEELLRAGGFTYLADVLYLVSLADEFPAEPPRGSLVFEPYSAANHQRLARVVEATYHETRDCPRLNGVRHVEDVLAGYREGCQFDPCRWFIVRHAGADVGCLLLGDHPDHGNLELIYMGVVVAARGHGWAAEIARYAQWIARQMGRPRLVLAVDAANGPAIRAYAAAGFQTCDERRVYVKLFPTAA